MNDKVPYRIPQTWEWTELGDIAEIVRVQVNPQLTPKAKFNYLSIENVEANSGALVNFAPSLGGKIKSAKIAFTTRDILYSKLRPYLNKVHLPIFDGISATDLIPIRPLGGIKREYLGYFLRTRFVVEYANQKTRGIQLPRLPVDDLLKLHVPVAPISEQGTIVGKIEKAYTEIRTAKRALQKVHDIIKQFRQSVLAKAFRGEITERDPKDEPACRLLERVQQEHRKRWEEDVRARGKDPKYKSESPEIAETEGLFDLPESWTWTSVGAIETFIGSGITPLGGRNVYVSDGIAFIRSQNVHSDGLHLEDIVYVTRKMHAEMKRSHVIAGDVLLNITGASIGRSTYVPDNFGEANVNQHVCIIRTGPWIVPAYLSNFLNSPLGQDQIFATESGVTRESLNYGQIRQLKVPIATLNEQKQIVQRISEMFSLATLATRAALEATKRTDSLEQSILLRAFQGRLVPQEHNEEPVSVLLERISAYRAGTSKKRKSQPILEVAGPGRIAPRASR